MESYGEYLKAFPSGDHVKDARAAMRAKFEGSRVGDQPQVQP